VEKPESKNAIYSVKPEDQRSDWWSKNRKQVCKMQEYIMILPDDKLLF